MGNTVANKQGSAVVFVTCLVCNKKITLPESIEHSMSCKILYVPPEENEEEIKKQEERKKREEEERILREEEEKRKSEEEERIRREEQEKRKREVEERKKEEERKKREEEERIREEERIKREEDERKKREDEERKRKAEEEERIRREEEEKRKREEEERKKREEEERIREEERIKREEDGRKKAEDEKKRREEEEKKREEEERRKREQEQKKEKSKKELRKEKKEKEKLEKQQKKQQKLEADKRKKLEKERKAKEKKNSKNKENQQRKIHDSITLEIALVNKSASQLHQDLLEVSRRITFDVKSKTALEKLTLFFSKDSQANLNTQEQIVNIDKSLAHLHLLKQQILEAIDIARYANAEPSASDLENEIAEFKEQKKVWLKKKNGIEKLLRSFTEEQSIRKIKEEVEKAEIQICACDDEIDRVRKYLQKIKGTEISIEKEAVEVFTEEEEETDIDVLSLINVLKEMPSATQEETSVQESVHDILRTVDLEDSQESELLYEFTAEMNGKEYNFKAGERVIIDYSVQDDEWNLVTNQSGEQFYVPVSYLKSI